MKTLKTLKIVSLAFALSLTAVSSARAAESAEDLAEAGAPDSILNSRGTYQSQAAGLAQQAQLAEAESGNPHAVNYGQRMLSVVNQSKLAQDVVAAESGNPHAVRR